MNNLIHTVFISSVVLLYSCIGCNNSSKNTNKKLNVFRYNQASGIASLDPAFAKDQSTIWPCFQLYSTLVQLDTNLEVKPLLAHKINISEDGLTYTFTLRDDVFFHNDDCFPSAKGRKLNAYDVVYSFSRILDPKTASPGSWVFNYKVDEINPFTALNDSTFVLKLRESFKPMLGILSMQYCSVIPKEAVEKYGAGFRSHPVGSGPFKFKKWMEGSALVLVKNENYFEIENGVRFPKLDGIKVSFIDNKKTEFLSFKKGELDFISGIESGYIDETLTENGELKPEWSGKMILHKTPYLNTEYLGFLMNDKNEKNPLLNKDIRLAINYGIDRNEMLKFIRNGVGKPALHGFTPFGLPSYNQEIKGFEYNPEKSKALLKKAGFEMGRGLPEIKLYTNESYKDLAIFVSKQLESIGLKIKVEINQPSLLREWMSNSKVPFFRGSWIADYPDAENFFTVFYSKNTSPPNYTRFNNKEFDRLYESSIQETDDNKRYAMYWEMEKILIEESPVVPLYYDEVLRFTQTNVKGIEPNGQNLLDLRRVYLDAK